MRILEPEAGLGFLYVCEGGRKQEGKKRLCGGWTVGRRRVEI